MSQSIGGGGSGGIAKVLVVGNVATGKTSVVNRFAKNESPKAYRPAICDFVSKRVRMGASELNVQLWDIAGQERFPELRRLFPADAVAAVIVYDVTSRATFDSVIQRKQDIDSKVFLPSGAKVPVLLLGNKSDLLGGEAGAPSCVSPEELKQIVEEHGFFAHAECSAATGANVEESIFNLVAKIHQNNQTEMSTPVGRTAPETPSQPVNLSQPATEQSGACCG